MVRAMHRRSRGALRAAAITATLLLGGCLLYPQRSRPGDRSADHTFVARAESIAERRIGIYERRLGTGEPQLVVLAFTGNAGLAQYQVDASAQLFGQWLRSDDDAPRGAVVLAMQYPGYGGDYGNGSSMTSIAAAALEAVAWAQQQHPGVPLLVHGQSIGTTCALHVANQLPVEVAGVLLEKPPNLFSMILWRYGWWNAWLIALPYALSLPASACSEDLAAGIADVPVLFVVGRRDDIAPPAYAREVFEACAGPKRWVDADTGHGGHPTAGNAPALHDGLRWLWQAASHR